MLTQLSIRDFALIEQLDLELTSGLTVMTGETGAGKSIVIDALSIVLGERADPTLIRHGADQSDIIADFVLAADHPVHPILEALELDDGGNCLLRRTVARNGRSRAFINGCPVPVQQLKQIGDLVADIYGQHAHQSLMSADAQRDLLDAYLHEPTLLHSVKEDFKSWQNACQALAQLQENQSERAQRLELLNYQLSEFDDIDPQAGEMDMLEQERNILAASQQLESNASHALNTLYEGEGAVSDTLGVLVRRLGELTSIDARLQDIAALIDNALIQTDEAAMALRGYLGRLESDPGRLEAVNDRLAQLQALLRKHQCDYVALLEKRHVLADERARLENLGQNLDSAEQTLIQSRARYVKQARALSEARARAAARLSEEVSARIQQLGMPKGQFIVEVRRRDEGDDSGFRQHGLDAIVFLVTANPGLPAKELAKVASGGEISRISLAIQVVLAGGGVIDTLVFDEVDVGVGGAVAEIVGRQLRRLATRKQIFCITHLPQVAAQGHQHLRVSKIQGEDRTHSTLLALEGAARVEELARMLGGVQITEQTKATAREMLTMAGSAA